MALVTLNGANDSFIDSNTGNTVTVETTSTDTLSTYPNAYGGVSANSYWIGQGAETHTHTFSEPVTSISIDYGAVANNTTVVILLDGVAVNLNDLISSGQATMTTLSGTNPFSVEADGSLLGVGVQGSSNIGRLELNMDTSFTTLEFASSGDSAGWLYELGVDDTSVVCFTSGTLIKTQFGEVAVQDLTKGMLVHTLDHGMQPIRWIGSSKRRAVGNLAPILIRKGALGNTRDLRVSPQHRMLLSGWQAELLFGEVQVLATAKSLINDHSITREEGGEVEYFHMLFDTHEIVFAEGAPSESFHPGIQGWTAFDQATRDEILELFPQLSDENFQNYGPSARMSLKHKEGALLGENMIEGTGTEL